MRWGRDRGESKERDVLIGIMGLARNVAPEKFPGIHKFGASYDPKQQQRRCLTGLPVQSA